MAQLCATVTASTLAELRARRDAAARVADLVEVRLDTVADPDVAGILAGRLTPLIVTCRPVWEGGHFKKSEDDRMSLLEQAWRLGAEYVDVEWAAWSRAPWIGETRGQRLIVSSHDFRGVPADLRERHAAMSATGAAVVKVAVTASSLVDCLRLTTLTVAGPQQQVVLAMGAAGLVTRILPDRFRSCWTYAGDGIAPGQLPAERLRAEFRFGETSAKPAVFGIVANPVGHSVSPAMHNSAFRAAGIDAVYVPLQAADASDLLAFADAFDVRGVSVTVPFKVDVLPHCEPDEPGARAGAINTLKRGERGWLGRNTDIPGLLAPLRDRIALAGARVAILGAGGAARGAAIALTDAGARVTICARRFEVAQAVASDTGAVAAPMPPAPGSWDVLVNATSAGMHPRDEETPWPDARFDGALVYDLVYNPEETRLLREARAAGCDTIGGLPMLVAQAGLQYEWWTGQPPAPGVMEHAAKARLAAFRARELSAPPVPPS